MELRKQLNTSFKSKRNGTLCAVPFFYALLQIKNKEDFVFLLNMIDKKFNLCYKYMARGEMAERLNAHDSKSCYG